MTKFKAIIRTGVVFLLIPLSIVLGVTVFRDRSYIWIALCVTTLSCVPFFTAFEKGKDNTKRMMILSVMTALSVLGRFAFAAVPHFKPVTAIVIIVGMYLGAESGFLCGALSAILSNIFFGQGPWTPFQMFTWGLIGLIAALMSPILKKSRIALSVFAVLSGFLYSLIMDIWTVISYENVFNFRRYIAATIASFPISAIYGISNLIFLIILAKPIGAKLERIMIKYGI